MDRAAKARPPLREAGNTSSSGRHEGAQSSGFRRTGALGSVSEGEGRRLRRAISGAKAGDRDALRYLYCRYADNVYGYVCSILRDEHEAEDVTQNVFAKLMSAIHKYERREVPFSAWILRIARNAALDHLRQRRAIPVADVRPATGAEDEHVGNRDVVWDALRQVAPDHRRVVLMRHLLGLSAGEIADELGKTEAAVHGLHHRGRAAARRELVTLDAAPATMPA